MLYDRAALFSFLLSLNLLFLNACTCAVGSTPPCTRMVDYSALMHEFNSRENPQHLTLQSPDGVSKLDSPMVSSLTDWLNKTL